jgi:prevent-host-death family protein
MPGGIVPISWARANLGPLIRWTARTHKRTTISDRGRATAILISPQELARLDQAQYPADPTRRPTARLGTPERQHHQARDRKPGQRDRHPSNP